MTQTLEPVTIQEQATATATAPHDAQWIVQWLDPRTLLVDYNVRTEADLDRDFLESIRELGVMQPIIAVQCEQGVRVRLGHRRTLGAIKEQQPRVPVIVIGDERTDDAGQIERLFAQWDENEQRTGLRDGDKIVAVQQLSAFGVSAAQIKKRTKWHKDQVRTALTVAASELATKSALRYDLTLDQAAMVEEFKDDAPTVKALIAAVRTGQFAHVAQRARDARDTERARVAEERAEQEAKAPVLAALTAAGVRVLDSPYAVPTVKRLSALTDNRETREPITAEQHASCPGHAAYLVGEWVWVDTEPTQPTDTTQQAPNDDGEDEETDDGDGENTDDEEEGREEQRWEAVFVCCDPAEHGHEPVYQSPAGTRLAPPAVQEDAATAAARSAKRRETVKNNQDWASAEKVRIRWVRDFLTRKNKSAPKGTGVFLAAALALHGDTIASTGGNHLAAQWLGINTTTTFGCSPDLVTLINTATDARAQVIHLGIVLAAYENASNREDWRTVMGTTTRYLTHLETLDYQLSDVEQLACGRTPQAHDDDLDADSTPSTPSTE